MLRVEAGRPYGLENAVLLFAILTVSCFQFAVDASFEHAAERAMAYKGGLHATLITASFTHRSVTHLASNLVSLWVIGFAASALLRGPAFFAFFLASGAVSFCSHVAILPGSIAGASGGIRAMLGLVAVISPHAKFDMPAIPVLQRFNILVWHLLLFYLALDGYHFMAQDRYSYACHLSGVVAGAAVGGMYLLTSRFNRT